MPAMTITRLALEPPCSPRCERVTIWDIMRAFLCLSSERALRPQQRLGSRKRQLQNRCSAIWSWSITDSPPVLQAQVCGGGLLQILNLTPPLHTHLGLSAHTLTAHIAIQMAYSSATFARSSAASLVPRRACDGGSHRQPDARPVRHSLAAHLLSCFKAKPAACNKLNRTARHPPNSKNEAVCTVPVGARVCMPVWHAVTAGWWPSQPQAGTPVYPPSATLLLHNNGSSTCGNNANSTKLEGNTASCCSDKGVGRARCRRTHALTVVS